MTGGAPGAVVEYDNMLRIVGEYPANKAEIVNYTTGFNPVRGWAGGVPSSDRGSSDSRE